MKTKRPSTAPSSEKAALIPNGMQTLIEDDDTDDVEPVAPTLSATCSSTPDTYDWSAFITLYAMGKWDPHKIPNPPTGIICNDSPTDEFELTAIPHRKPSRTPNTVHRMRNSFSSSSVPPPASSQRIKPELYLNIASPKPSTPSSVVSAATLRLAGTHVNLSPLALPSPEHELTDPMRGVSVVVPGVHPDDSPNEVVMTPGGTRKIMLKNFWKAVSQPEEEAVADDPLMTTPTDYFNHHDSIPLSTEATTSTSASTTPKRASLTRQTSAPLPTPLAAPAPITLGPGITDRDTYAELGYLAAPNPPDEDKRKQALYKFNLWGTTSDVNFDRIAHLAKLVFNTKGVYISLIDANDQYFKSEWGIKVSSCSRRESFCGHTILQRDDEPTIILDTRQDWRFTSNPLVVESPHIRFYAGAPLRTADGYNVGTLAVIDDAPREDFTPRHRHTLKEFAAIAMREMELWRDKIQLKVRDRIQRSMEQFSRECIEIDMAEQTKSKSMESDHSGLTSASPASPPSHASAPSTPAPAVLIPAGTHADPTERPSTVRSPLQPPSSNSVTSSSMVETMRTPTKVAMPQVPSTPTVIAATPDLPSSSPVIQPHAVVEQETVIDTALTPPWTPPPFTTTTMDPSSGFSSSPRSPSSQSSYLEIPSSTPESQPIPFTESLSRPSLLPRYSSHQHRSFLQTGSMEKVYSRAARLVQRTLDVDDVIVMDVSHYDVNSNVTDNVVASPAVASTSGRSSGTPESSSTSVSSNDSSPGTYHLLAGSEGSVSVVMHHGDPAKPMEVRKLSAEEWASLGRFFEKYPEGKAMDRIVDKSWRAFLPTHVSYALTVPIFNIDKRPFALLCAYNSSTESNRPLEGHELSYLRAIGVIILSAVLKRRMILADKAKSLFISNISHELRTPLHGILAAAELLDESNLNHSQSSFLQTIQACGTSLVETVNHVLDFTKLSGNSKSGGVENVIVPTKVNLMQLVEEAVDGCWVGHRARQAIADDTGIGSVYSPPQQQVLSRKQNHVETVIEIGHRSAGWLVKCEKGGIRRVLMNLFGNSLKFTTNGYVHVGLRELPRAEDDLPGRIKVELSVLDTGKGINRNFQRNQLFHPFSQENPLQPGTGLGLAIVNSIIRSESVDGRIDVWSEEGVGTEIKVTFSAEVTDDENDSSVSDMEPFKFDDPDHPPTVSLVEFEADHRGVQLLASNVRTYLTSWWGFEIQPPGGSLGNIIILNEDVSLVAAATANHDTSRPFIVLSDSRGSPQVMSVASEHERIGGFCRMVYKPGGPSRLRNTLNLCVHALKIQAQAADSAITVSRHAVNPLDGMPSNKTSGLVPSATTILPAARRNSEESASTPVRPPISRSVTVHPTVPTHWKRLSSTSEQSNEDADEPETASPTITVGPGGTLLKSSVGTIQNRVNPFKILVVEDNPILRNLLVQWLSKKGYDFRDAADGRDGVNVYTQEGPFDVVLLDLSMPILDGVGATAEIRQFESEGPQHSTKILALTGMSSLEDKRRAFDAGVDGYLVKPVAFKTLDEMFHKLGMSP